MRPMSSLTEMAMCCVFVGAKRPGTQGGTLRNPPRANEQRWSQGPKGNDGILRYAWRPHREGGQGAGFGSLAVRVNVLGDI
jgi:hypothetical protein